MLTVDVDLMDSGIPHIYLCDHVSCILIILDRMPMSEKEICAYSTI